MKLLTKRILALLIAFGTLALIISLEGPRTTSATEDFRFDAVSLKDKSVWTQVNAEPYRISSRVDLLCSLPTPSDYDGERKRTGNPHIAPAITVYVNNVGREAMFAKEVRRFPEGSVIVKEKTGYFLEGRKPMLYTIMRKREPGFNPTVGDWEFAVVGADGRELQAIGKLEVCQGCHTKKSNSDFIFRPYLPLN